MTCFLIITFFHLIFSFCTTINLAQVDIQKCGVPVGVGKIVGGMDSGGYHYPWLAVLQLSRDFKKPIPICGGSLITSSHVLTAAHCIVVNPTFSIDLYSVALGVYNICDEKEATREIFKVSEIIVHEKYRKRQKFFDIALMKLARPSSYTTICLPILGVIDQTEAALLIGFGVTSEGSNATPCHLLQVNVTKFSKKDCSHTKLPSEDKREPTIICAGSLTGSVDSCYGDSGGPLQTRASDGRYTIVGIVSYGYGCAVPEVPGIYTNVGSYLNWITNKLSRSTPKSVIRRNENHNSDFFRHFSPSRKENITPFYFEQNFYSANNDDHKNKKYIKFSTSSQGYEAKNFPEKTQIVFPQN